MLDLNVATDTRVTANEFEFHTSSRSLLFVNSSISRDLLGQSQPSIRGLNRLRFPAVNQKDVRPTTLRSGVTRDWSVCKSNCKRVSNSSFFCFYFLNTTLYQPCLDVATLPLQFDSERPANVHQPEQVDV